MLKPVSLFQSRMQQRQPTPPSCAGDNNPATPKPARLYTSRSTQTTPGLMAQVETAVTHCIRTPIKSEGGGDNESADSNDDLSK